MFVLITGYFGLKLKWRSVINLVSITLFYSILSTFAYCLYTDTLPSLEVLKKTLFPISSGTYWFVTSYFYLLLLSPLLNFALHAMSDRQLCFFLAVLIFINCISSWLFQNNFNPNGYNTMQFILLYYIGYCIKNTTAFALVQKNCIPCAVFFQILMVISSIFTGAFLFYNSIVNIMLAVSIFYIFLKVDLQNKFINNIATSMFAVYLLQEGMFGRTVYHLMYEMYLSYSPMQFVVVTLIYLFMLFAFAIILERIRNYILSPLNIIITDYLNKKIPVPF